MNRILKWLLFAVSGNTPMQHCLEYISTSSHYLMGIGTGGSNGTSGEHVLSNEMVRLYLKLRTPLCIFDVGANRGQFLDMMIQRLSDVPVDYHVFEPSSFTFELLRKNTASYKNVHINNLGLGRTQGEFELHYNHPGATTASLTKRQLAHFGTEMQYIEKVTIDTLDHYCLVNNIRQIDLLKLDVEGHELDVLRGAERMFTEQRIQMVSFEFGGCDIDTRVFFQDFWYFFLEYGLKKMYRITPAGTLTYLSGYKEVYEQFRTTNFVVKKD